MKYLAEYIDGETTRVLNKYGAFWAFSDKQFNEQKKEGVKYSQLQSGLVVPEDNASALMEELDNVIQAGIAKDLEENTKYGVIRRELFNHEAFYTCDTSSTIAVLSGYKITPDEVKKVYREILKNETPALTA